MLFDTKGKIIWATYNAPGSWHDSYVARNLYLKLDLVDASYYILGDIAFQLHEIIKASLKEGDTERIPANALPQALELHRYITFNRQCAEWGNRGVVSSFSRLKLNLPADHTKRERILTVVLRLFNFAAEFVGINQIRTFFENIESFAISSDRVLAY